MSNKKLRCTPFFRSRSRAREVVYALFLLAVWHFIGILYAGIILLVYVPMPKKNKENESMTSTLKAYFSEHKGTGVLATADDSGKVDAAIYSSPHFMDDGSIAFIMRDRLTHHNLQSNPYATFLFIEERPGYEGKRLFLKKVREEQNPELIKKIKRRKQTDNHEEPRFLVYFDLEKELPLIGSSPR